MLTKLCRHSMCKCNQANHLFAPTTASLELWNSSTWSPPWTNHLCQSRNLVDQWTHWQRVTIFFGFIGVISGSQIWFSRLNQHRGGFQFMLKKKGLLRSFLYASFLILKIMPQRVFKGRLRIVFDQSSSRIRTSGSIILLKWGSLNFCLT